MRLHSTHPSWDKSLEEFCRRNRARKARMITVDSTGRYGSHYGLSLSGVALDVDADGSPKVEIMFGGRSARDSDQFVHTVRHVRRITPSEGLNSCDTLEVEDQQGGVTLLDFGPLTALGES